MRSGAYWTMDFDRGRTRHESLRLRPRRSRLERSGVAVRRTVSRWPRISTSCSIARTFTGPFVLVGHSSGAQYVRIFAGRYPEQVAGMVLLDGQPAEAFEGLPSYPAFYSVFRRVFALLPSLARLGVGRLLSGHRLTSASFRATPAACATSSPSCRPRWRRHVRFRASAIDRSSSSRPRATRWRGGCRCRTRWRRCRRTAATRRAVHARRARHRRRWQRKRRVRRIRDVVHAVRFAAPLKKS